MLERVMPTIHVKAVSRVAEAMRNSNADFIGTQELMVDQWKYLKRMTQYAAIGECAGDCSTEERVAIFYHDFCNFLHEFESPRGWKWMAFTIPASMYMGKIPI